MITITQPLSKLDQNLTRINEPLRRIEKRTAASIRDLNESFHNFWNLTDEEINEIFAFHGLEKITQILTSHYEHGTALNKLLEDREITEPRAITTKPRDLTVVDGALQIVPLPVPELVIEESVEETPVEEEIPL